MLYLIGDTVILIYMFTSINYSLFYTPYLIFLVIGGKSETYIQQIFYSYTRGMFILKRK